MKNVDLKKTTFLKIMIPVIIVWGIITIFRGGMAFGSWLHAFIH